MRDDHRDGKAHSVHFAAGLFIVGAVVFWVGARTFPGMSLGKVHANLEGHIWTSINFLIATVITLAALALSLWRSGERVIADQSGNKPCLQ